MDGYITELANTAYRTNNYGSNFIRRLALALYVKYAATTPTPFEMAPFVASLQTIRELRIASTDRVKYVTQHVSELIRDLPRRIIYADVALFALLFTDTLTQLKQVLETTLTLISSPDALPRICPKSTVTVDTGDNASVKAAIISANRAVWSAAGLNRSGESQKIYTFKLPMDKAFINAALRVSMAMDPLWPTPADAVFSALRRDTVSPNIRKRVALRHYNQIDYVTVSSFMQCAEILFPSHASKTPKEVETFLGQRNLERAALFQDSLDITDTIDRDGVVLKRMGEIAFVGFYDNDNDFINQWNDRSLGDAGSVAAGGYSEKIKSAKLDFA